jgi:hypothetical protein
MSVGHETSAAADAPKGVSGRDAQAMNKWFLSLVLPRLAGVHVELSPFGIDAKLARLLRQLDDEQRAFVAATPIMIFEVSPDFALTDDLRETPREQPDEEELVFASVYWTMARQNASENRQTAVLHFGLTLRWCTELCAGESVSLLRRLGHAGLRPFVLGAAYKFELLAESLLKREPPKVLDLGRKSAHQTVVRQRAPRR